MISYFLKPRHRHSLARCAVVFPLYAGLLLIVPIVAYRPWTSYLLPPTATGWLLGLPFWLWMGWVAFEWVRLVLLVRAQPVRSSSISALFAVGIICLVFVPLDMLVLERHIDMAILNIWLVAVETALLVFFMNYFLLALCTWTRVPWQAAVCFLLIVGCLGGEIYSANHHGG